MRAFLTGLLVASLVAAPAAQAASITLACSGNVTAPGEPEKTTVDDLSIIVDLDKSTVVSEKIWDRPIPFIAIDANEVKFRADINYGSSSVSLYGTIDRITGKTDIGTDRTFRLKNGNAVMTENWDLRCKPSKSLF